MDLPNPYDVALVATEPECAFGADMYDLLSAHGFFPGEWARKNQVVTTAIAAIHTLNERGR